ncbi:MAG TPA: hypothetical protein VHH34_23600 [Pseudonocardiaceae bacterium]|nr:hypothetical protein [Pseudonocardiaceae bacterium]
MATVDTAREDSSTDGLRTTRVAETPEAGSAGQPALFDAAALPQVLKIFGSVVAPTTLLTALMYYFGRLQAAAFLWYLGAPVTVLDLTIQDYLNNSVDGMIPPLIAGAGTALVALWAHQFVLGALSAGTRRRALRVLLPVAALTGLILVMLAIPVFPSFPEARGLSLAIGVLLLFYAARLFRLLVAERRPEQVPRRTSAGVAVAEWGAVFILVSVGLFWAVGSYAIGAGVGRAQLLESSLPTRSDVVVYSEKRLSLQAPGIREVACQTSDAAYRFRYEGLKLVQQAGNQYLFLPAGWTHADGTAILLPRSESLRLEFSPAGRTQNAPC